MLKIHAGDRIYRPVRRTPNVQNEYFDSFTPPVSDQRQVAVIKPTKPLPHMPVQMMASDRKIKGIAVLCGQTLPKNWIFVEVYGKGKSGHTLYAKPHTGTYDDLLAEFEALKANVPARIYSHGIEHPSWVHGQQIPTPLINRAYVVIDHGNAMQYLARVLAPFNSAHPEQGWLVEWLDDNMRTVGEKKFTIPGSSEKATGLMRQGDFYLPKRNEVKEVLVETELF